jgi:hypothetical protein
MKKIYLSIETSWSFFVGKEGINFFIDSADSFVPILRLQMH